MYCGIHIQWTTPELCYVKVIMMDVSPFRAHHGVRGGAHLSLLPHQLSLNHLVPDQLIEYQNIKGIIKAVPLTSACSTCQREKV
jgi:hypothetical protein